MGLYTCDACLYTFRAEKMPERCPDCGKESVMRKLSANGGSVSQSCPAVRPATEAEKVHYEEIQAEIALEEAAVREEAQNPPF